MYMILPVTSSEDGESTKEILILSFFLMALYRLSGLFRRADGCSILVLTQKFCDLFALCCVIGLSAVCVCVGQPPTIELNSVLPQPFCLQFCNLIYRDFLLSVLFCDDSLNAPAWTWTRKSRLTVVRSTNWTTGTYAGLGIRTPSPISRITGFQDQPSTSCGNPAKTYPAGFEPASRINDRRLSRAFQYRIMGRVQKKLALCWKLECISVGYACGYEPHASQRMTSPPVLWRAERKCFVVFVAIEGDG